jgi:hypothetical protein
MIIAAEVKRDEQGYWTHPALARSGCETSAELSYWLRTHKLQCFVMTMRDEAPEAFAAGFTDEAPDARGWIPEPPDDDGWFLGSVRYRRRTRLLLVSSYHKILTPPHGVVVQPRNGEKPVSPLPAFLKTPVKEIL